jgi:prepilin-type N-terminal cleavage/methylation domain-containing protein
MRLITGQRGQTLLEVLIAIVILGMIAVPFLTALSVSSRAIMVADDKAAAESLIRSELEYVKDSPYNFTGFSYVIPATPDNPPPWDSSRIALDDCYISYSVNVTGVPISPDTGAPLPPGEDLHIQKITVVVYHGNRTVLAMSTYKADR